MPEFPFGNALFCNKTSERQPIAVTYLTEIGDSRDYRVLSGNLESHFYLFFGGVVVSQEATAALVAGPTPSDV